LPPHVSAKQVKHYVKALLQGDTQARGVIVATLREAWDSLTKGRG
jgi:pyruvate dehydrogenase (quinone)